MKFTNDPKHEDLMRAHQGRGGGKQVWCYDCDRWVALDRVRLEHAHEADSDE